MRGEYGNYLRVRGEYLLLINSKLAAVELPPRARRILPKLFAVVQGHRNYLRVRGEYSRSRFTRSSSVELPPRARRIPQHAIKFPAFLRTTSACAENTATLAATRSCDWNYLRVRGEYSLKNRVRLDAWELPPRARRIRWPF